jgi:alpha-beta hydrolase superfamily lysophospholipase
MQPDVLGDDYQCQALPMGQDAYGNVVAHLVRYVGNDQRGHDQPGNDHLADTAILAVHGWSDYFFATHVAESFAAQGHAFYALDLRGHGRSLRPEEPANYCTDLAVYDAELAASVELIRSRHRRIVILGHSTGGLITALWAHRHRDDTPPVDALILNSPWLDLAGSWVLRSLGTAVNDHYGRWYPTRVVRGSGSGPYGQSIHADKHGEWRYDLRWKPHGGFPVRAGWLRAVRRGHAEVQRGLDIAAPVLVLHSTQSLLGTTSWAARASQADTVLDVAQIARWAPSLGTEVTVLRVSGALHDVYLSAEPVRRFALDSTHRWLRSVLIRTTQEAQ